MIVSDAPDVSLLDVVGHMLADGGYIMAEPDPAPAPVEGFRVAVRFAGRHSGEVILDASRGLGMEMATNLADADEVPTMSTASEALRELANMITGALLPRLFGAQLVFELGIPSAVAEVDASSDAPDSDHHVSLVTDEGHALQVWLRLDGAEGGPS